MDSWTLHSEGDKDITKAVIAGAIGSGAMFLVSAVGLFFGVRKFAQWVKKVDMNKGKEVVEKDLVEESALLDGAVANAEAVIGKRLVAKIENPLTTVARDIEGTGKKVLGKLGHDIKSIPKIKF